MNSNFRRLSAQTKTAAVFFLSDFKVTRPKSPKARTPKVNEGEKRGGEADEEDEDDGGDDDEVAVTRSGYEALERTAFYSELNVLRQVEDLLDRCVAVNILNKVGGGGGT